ncbi:hypothetical protein ANN_12851 [Periplaneta americana]|uniref:Uncharacterized protein n=1 Tax=Periplaneta americana TaxID=6978 RepID=A0ABQ8THQ5_PERAM|nr:hypothetical protein ANN_12851 [Periplaneta americana]
MPCPSQTSGFNIPNYVSEDNSDGDDSDDDNNDNSDHNVPRRRWQDNIKMDLREVGYDVRDWINLAQDRDRWRAYTCGSATMPNTLCAEVHSLRVTKCPGSDGMSAVLNHQVIILGVQFKVCHGSLYAVMWLADEPREFNLPTLPQKCIT